jgi:tetratricopeptide (TPR) repeat protein
VAGAVTAYLVSVQERLRSAEVGRAAAQAKAEEARAKAAAERRARRLLAGLAAAVLALALVGGGGGLWIKAQRDARVAAFQPGWARATLLFEEGKWEAALAAAEALPDPGDEKTRRQVHESVADLHMLLRLAEIRASRWERFEKRQDPEFDYAQAFREYGIDVEAPAPEEAAASIRARPDGIARELVAALDDWAYERRYRQPEGLGWRRLVDIAQAAEGEPRRRRIRDLLVRQDLPALRQLADDPDTLREPVQTLHLLGVTLAERGAPEAAISLLRRAQRRYPGDAWINTSLASSLQATRPGQLDEAVGFYRVAAAFRPELGHVLVHALMKKGNHDEAIAILHGLIRRRPGNATYHSYLGMVLYEKGQYKEAVSAYDEAILRKPDYAAAHNNRGNALTRLGRLDEAIASFQESIRFREDDALSYLNLGLALAEKEGGLREAVKAFGKALRYKQRFAEAYCARGNALTALYRFEDALADYDNAIDSKPDFAVAQYNRGNILQALGRLEDAVPAYDRAIALQPGYVEAHYNRGRVLAALGRLDEAVAAFQGVVRLQPDYAEAHFNLGLSLVRQGEFARALRHLQHGHQLGFRNPGWPDPSAEWVQRCQRWRELDGRLPAILRGEVSPVGDGEHVVFAELCAIRQLPDAAAGFYQKCLAANPKLGANPEANLRYRAATQAALAGCGQGKDDPPPDEPARTCWRKQALGWLRADLTRWTEQLNNDPSRARYEVQYTLRQWKRDPDLAGLRDPAGLAKLSQGERQEWEELWQEVNAIRARAGSPR